MPPTLPAVRPRPAVASNEAIRAIAIRAQGRAWTRAELALYRLLVDEWLTAVGDVAEAA